MTQEKQKRDYMSIGIYNNLIKEIDDLLDQKPRYRSRLEFIHEALRLRLEEVKKETQKKDIMKENLEEP